MAGIGLFLLAIAYAIIYWGIGAISGNSQGSFESYIFPFLGSSSIAKSVNVNPPPTGTPKPKPKPKPKVPARHPGTN